MCHFIPGFCILSHKCADKEMDKALSGATVNLHQKAGITYCCRSDRVELGGPTLGNASHHLG